MDKKVEKLYKLIIVALVLIGLLFIIVICGMFKTKDNSSNNNSNNASTNEYDVSSFDELKLSEIVKLFDDKKGTYIVYFGRPTCSACVKFLPTLKKMQEKYKYVTKYMDITNVDATSEDFKTLAKKLNKEVTLTVNGETKTQEFGDFYGYTPMTFIVKKGKFVNGIVGAYSEGKFESFLNDNGIK